MPTAFISYSHDNKAHSERVLQLAAELCKNGVDAELDQFHDEEILDWPRWCEEMLRPEASDFVICVCTREYRDRIENRVPPERGKGVYWEGSLIDDDLYDARDNARYIPVFLNERDVGSVPRILRGWTYCLIKDFSLTNAGFEKLLRILHGELKIPKPPIGRRPNLPQRILAATSAGPRHNLPARHKRFVGRKSELNKIHRLLNESKRVGVTQELATHAHGGVGKTALAHEYAWRHLEDYPGGLFVVGCDVDALLPAMAELAAPLGVEERETPEKTVREIIRVLENGEPSLLILDNVRDSEQWKNPDWAKWLPGGKRRRLITTRALRLKGVGVLRIGGLSRAKGVELLAKYRADARKAANKKIVGNIVEWFDGLAVGLTVVGVYMQQQPELSWDRYAKSLFSRGLDAVRATDKMVDGLPDYDRRVDSVFDDALATLTDPQRRAMEYAALLPEDTVLDHWLVWLLEHDDSLTLPKDQPGYEEHPAEKIVADLRGLGLLTSARTGENVLAVHRVLRRRLRELLGKDEELRERLLEGVVALAKFRGNASHDALTDKSLRPELSPLVALVEELEASDRFWPAVRLANWLTTPLKELGRLVEDRSQLTRLESRIEDLQGEVDEKGLATLLSNLSVTLADLGDLPGARSRMERAIEIWEKAYDADHPTLAVSYSNLAGILKDLGDLPGARSRMERAIEIGEKAYEADHPTLATSYSNLAMILQDLGDLPGARSRMERAIEIEEKAYDADHPALAVSYSNLAGILKNLGDLPGARSRMERAIEIEEEAYDADHPTLAVSYSNLAMILKDLGDLAGARSRMERAIEIDEKAYDADHPTLAIRYSNLAAILQDLGDLSGARSRIERAIEIDEKAYDPDHPLLATRYHNMAAIVFDEGDARGALDWEERAFAICKQHFDDDHPTTKTISRYLAKYKAAVGQDGQK